MENADPREDTDILAKEQLGVVLKPEDINRSHRVSKRSSKPRPIIGRLSGHNMKVEIPRRERCLNRTRGHRRCKKI